MSINTQNQSNQTIQNSLSENPHPQTEISQSHNNISNSLVSPSNNDNPNYLQNFPLDEELDYLFDNYNTNSYPYEEEDNDSENDSSNNSSNHQDTSTINSNELFINDNSEINDNSSNNKVSTNSSNKINETISHKNKNNSNKSNSNDTVSKSMNKSMMLIPFSNFERFKQSVQFKYLEACYFFINKLSVYKVQNKYDFENDYSNEICKDLFEQIENLQKYFNVKITNRNYRKKFTQAYISLYEEDSFGYLTEILDSAQEATPYLVVNGEKFIFSQEVIDYGNQLINSFSALIALISDTMNLMYEEVIYENVKKIKIDIKSALIDFDKKWALYEEKYISELIYIEKISRRFIFEGIKIEKELAQYEKRATIRGRLDINNDKEYNEIRERFVKVINELNKIANINGKGRDDLTIEILLKSETVLCTVSDIKSKGMRKLAMAIKNTVNDFRELFKKYNMNIEGVDPQLVNNPELVSLLYNFEILWEKGKKYFTDKNKYNHLLLFNQIVEVIGEKYSNEQIKNLIDQSDPIIFVTIPAVLILRAIDNKDVDIIKQYIPNIDNKNEENCKLYSNLAKVVKEVYDKVKDNYYGYNLFEKFVLFDGTDEEEKITNEMRKYIDSAVMKDFKKDIKILSMNMQRYKPKEWNEFFQLAMEIE